MARRSFAIFIDCILCFMAYRVGQTSYRHRSDLDMIQHFSFGVSEESQRVQTACYLTDIAVTKVCMCKVDKIP